jgi:hypothetical protein
MAVESGAKKYLASLEKIVSVNLLFFNEVQLAAIAGK